MTLSDNDVTQLKPPPEFIFEVDVDGEPRARVFRSTSKREFVFWNLSRYVLALEAQGDVSVRRFTNGKWSEADDWRQLTH